MDEMFNRIDDLQEYSFMLGIKNSYATITLNDGELAQSSDFLMMLEQGSPLHNVTASRPIERTWLTMKNLIVETYETCVDMIIKQDTKQQFIEEKLINLANLLKFRLQMFVDSRIRDQITCYIFYKGRKIN